MLFVQQNKFNSTVNGTSLHLYLIEHKNKEYVEYSISEYKEELVPNK